MDVYPVNVITGAFHMWLPIQPLTGPDVRFIRPNPDVTVTNPGLTSLALTTGGYDGLTGIRYLQSGRGFSGTGQVKPEACAPAVDVSGANLRQGYVKQTGTSGAAAITAGAAALVLEWGILRGYAPTMNSVEVRNFLIRGCDRDIERGYPNTEWGYGRLDLYRSFEMLR